MPTLKIFSLKGTAGNLEGVVHIPDTAPRAIAVVAHPLPTMGGTMENKVAVTLAKALTELGCVTLRFNFRGVGASEGEFTGGDGEEQDLIAVVHYAKEQFGDELPLILSGFSFGGYVVGRAAQHLHPQHLILAGPAVGRPDMPAVPPNTLVIHGELDELVPLTQALAWASRQQLSVVVLPQADHYFHRRLTQLRDIVLRHFNGVKL